MGTFDKDALIAAMKDVFGDDTRRIDHALRVLCYAEIIMADEPGDKDTITAAAIVHDIGIPNCEKKYGYAGGQEQELEGPPVARPLLAQCGLPAASVDQACRIIASHHSPGEMDSAEFKVIWDADWMVNLPEEVGIDDPVKTEALISRIFLTVAGRNLAMRTFLS